MKLTKKKSELHDKMKLTKVGIAWQNEIDQAGIDQMKLTKCGVSLVAVRKWEEEHFYAIQSIQITLAQWQLTEANEVKQNNEHQDKGLKCFCFFFSWVSPLYLGRSYDSFVYKYCIAGGS